MLDNPVKRSGFIILAIGLIMLTIIGINKLSKMTKKKSNNQNQQQVAVDYYEPVDRYFKSIQEKDAAKLKAALPSFLPTTEEELKPQIEQFYTQFEPSCGSNVKFEYSFVKAVKMSDEDAKKYDEALKKTYKVDGTVREVYQIQTRIAAQGDKSSLENVYAMYVCSIDGKWMMVI